MCARARARALACVCACVRACVRVTVVLVDNSDVLVCRTAFLGKAVSVASEGLKDTASVVGGMSRTAHFPPATHFLIEN